MRTSLTDKNKRNKKPKTQGKPNEEPKMVNESLKANSVGEVQTPAEKMRTTSSNHLGAQLRKSRKIMQSQ